jgi:RNA polymerase sigma-70 factor (ECF subfamily)
VQTARNIFIDKSRRRKVRAEPNVSMEVLVEIPDERPLQYEVVLARECLRRVKRALELLSPRSREIYLMHRIDGMKYREIAAELKITSRPTPSMKLTHRLNPFQWIDSTEICRSG